MTLDILVGQEHINVAHSGQGDPGSGGEDVRRTSLEAELMSWLAPPRKKGALMYLPYYPQIIQPPAVSYTHLTLPTIYSV